VRRNDFDINLKIYESGTIPIIYLVLKSRQAYMIFIILICIKYNAYLHYI